MSEEKISGCQEEASPVERVIMCSLTDRELLLIINSVHDRSMKLLSIWYDMQQKHFRGPNGQIPTKENIDMVHKGHEEHLSIIKKIRGYMDI